MTREVLGEGCEVWLGDCLDVLPLLGKVDAVVTDPPYGIKRDHGFEGFEGFGGFGEPIARKQYSGDWDSCRPTKEVFDKIIEISTTAFIFGGNYFSDLLPVGNHWIVWDKKQTMPTFGDCELVWTNVKRNSVKWITREWNGLIGKEGKRIHATQKPVKIMTWILENYTQPGDLILDPFGGSMTTGVACHQTGRRFIGIEKDPTYYALGRKRLLDALAQPRLPGIDA